MEYYHRTSASVIWSRNLRLACYLAVRQAQVKQEDKNPASGAVSNRLNVVKWDMTTQDPSVCEERSKNSDLCHSSLGKWTGGFMGEHIRLRWF
jgi:hypothetical protein